MSAEEIRVPKRRNHSLLPSFDEEADETDREIAALEPAWGKASTFFRTGYRFGHAKGSMRCMSLIEVHRLLEVFHQRFKEGGTLAILQAIGHCAEENLPLPQWLAEAFQTRMTAFLRPSATHSLDEVFASPTIPTSSPKKAAAVRQDWQLGVQIFRDAWALAEDDDTLTSFDMTVDQILRAGNYGVGKTKAKALITMIEANQSRFLGKKISLSRFLEKRRKLLT